MADDVRPIVHPVGFHEMVQVFGQRGVVVHIGMGRAAVVALVEDEDGMRLRQLPGNGLPVVQRPKQPMKDDNGVALAECFIVEFQCRND